MPICRHSSEELQDWSKEGERNWPEINATKLSGVIYYLRWSYWDVPGHCRWPLNHPHQRHHLHRYKLFMSSLSIHSGMSRGLVGRSSRKVPLSLLHSPFAVNPANKLFASPKGIVKIFFDFRPLLEISFLSAFIQHRYFANYLPIPLANYEFH